MVTLLLMNLRHYSVRALLAVTTVACLLLAALVPIFRELSHFRAFEAFFSSEVALAAIPIIGAYVIGTLGNARGSLLASISLVSYALALMSPALRLAGEYSLFGWRLFMFSFLGTVISAGAIASEGFRWEATWYFIACTMGMVANNSIIVGYLSFISHAVSNKRLSLSRKCAQLGTYLALLVIFPLVLSTELRRIYIGYGLWAASFLLLAFGTGSAKTTDNIDQPDQELAT